MKQKLYLFVLCLVSCHVYANAVGDEQSESYIVYNPYTNVRELTSYIDDADIRIEIIGTKRSMPNKENDIYYGETNRDISDHERYAQSSPVYHQLSETGSMHINNLRLSLKKRNVSGTSNRDYIETEEFNTHCGQCELDQYENKGMHLFATIGEAKYFLSNTQRFDNSGHGEGQVTVDYLQDIDLTSLVETHGTIQGDGSHIVIDDDMLKDFEYRFELTSFKDYYGYGAYNESAFAAIYQDETTGHYFLHPQDSPDGFVGQPYNGGGKASPLVINHIPMVRVSLMDKNTVVDYGYLPIRITGEYVPPTPLPTDVICYNSGNSIIVDMDDDSNGVDGYNIYSILNYEFEKCLYDKYKLDYAHFSSIYSPCTTTRDLISDLDQFRIVNETTYFANPTILPIFELTMSGSPLEQSMIGQIGYNDYQVGAKRVGSLYWFIDRVVVKVLIKNGITNVIRAIKFQSNDPENYPDIYIIFCSGKLVGKTKENSVSDSDDLQDFINSLGDNKGTEEAPVEILVGDNGLTVDKDVDITDDLQLFINGGDVSTQAKVPINLVSGLVRIGMGCSFGGRNVRLCNSQSQAPGTTRAASATGGISNSGKLVFEESLFESGSYLVENLAGGTLLLKANTIVNENSGSLIANSGNTYIDGTVAVGSLQNKSGGRIYITSTLTKDVKISIAEASDIEAGTAIVLGGDGYTLTEADASHIHLSLPNGYEGAYDASKAGLVVNLMNGIANVSTTQPTVISTYDATGRRTDAKTKGLRIQRMSDGTVRKQYSTNK